MNPLAPTETPLDPEDDDELWAAELDASGGPEPQVKQLVVTDGGERLDKWLAAQLSDRSRAELQRWIASGLVVRNGQILKPSARLSAGDHLLVSIPVPVEYEVAAESIPLEIVYEDAHLLVIDKPAGMVVHPAAGNWHGTLVNAVLHHCPGLEGVGGTGRPGIVHRLDKDTSGLILVAKNDRSHRSLVGQFQSRSVSKRYVGLVYGRVDPPSAEINAAIGRDPRNRKRMAIVPAAHGRPASTAYQVRERFLVPGRRGEGAAHLTLLDCYPRTGRTHQIRVHLASVGHPIVGDAVYGPRRPAPTPCPRQFLHAAEIRFAHPVTGESLTLHTPLPSDLQAVLTELDWAKARGA